MEKLLKQAEVLAIERHPEACLGCGFEHSCSTHGCAVINKLVGIVRAYKNRIAAYEATGVDPEEIKTAIELFGCLDSTQLSQAMVKMLEKIFDGVHEKKDNVPLTLEELREMDGEPVWVQSDIFPKDCGYRVIQRAEILFVDFTDGRRLSLTDYDKSWLAYRHKPEGGKDNA